MTISTDTTDNFGSSKNAPAVTIVIPAYNSAQYIEDTLNSVKAQNFTDYEVIVVNDGSDDREELERILKSHPLPVIYILQENKGVSAARNAAIRVARGEFYAQLDADDQWTPDYLQVQLEILKKQSGRHSCLPECHNNRGGSNLRFGVHGSNSIGRRGKLRVAGATEVCGHDLHNGAYERNTPGGNV